MTTPAPARLLVIEDDIAKRYVLTHQLRDAGFKVEEAATGDAGLRLVSPEIDVVVLDIRLPDIDGYEVCRQIKANPATAPVMVLELSAAFVNPADRARGLELGADAYLNHPVEIDELIAAIRALVRLRTAERARAELTLQRDLMIASLGHALRNPLQTIQLATGVLETATALGPGERRALDQIARSATRMQRHVDQLQFFARTLVTGVPVVRRPTRLGEVVALVIAEAEAEHPGRKVELMNELEVSAEVDPDRFAQIVENLVDNALRHGTGPVSVGLRRDHGSAVLVVQNEGAEVPPEIKDGLASNFPRGMSRGGNVGLGLPIVQRIAKAHGGSLELSSSATAGTTVRVRLPLRDPHKP